MLQHQSDLCCQCMHLVLLLFLLSPSLPCCCSAANPPDLSTFCICFQTLESEQQLRLANGKQIPAFRSGDILEVSTVSIAH